MDTDTPTNLNTVPFRPKNTMGRFVLILLGVLLAGIVAMFFVVYMFFVTPPSSQVYPKSLLVESGDSLGEIAIHAEQINLVRSKTAFQTMMFILGNDTKIKAGKYVFEAPVNVIDVAIHVARGERDVTSLKITIPEGYTRKEIATLFEGKLKKFDSQIFLEKTKEKEGYLFPETYFFLEDSTTDQVVNELLSQFEKKTKTLDLKGKSLEEIVVMASIIEKEASGDDDRKIISGVLWKRLSLKMPLQVDATFKYILGKESSELTIDDLKTQSPYNTYIHRGLPPGPICNPGLESILAAIEPQSSGYLYYLHSDKGEVYFAKTFEEHKQNKARYLK